MRKALIALALLLAGCQQERLSYDGHVFKAREVAGPEPAGGWDEVLQVYSSAEPGAPPMLGVYRLRGHTLTFTPSFKPDPQLPLRMVLHPAGGGIETLTIPGKASAKAESESRVTAVYPTTGDWPANQLKFYIQFSAPMTRGVAWSHIHLINENGAAVQKPFVEIDQELWDPRMTRLTVLFDPGRIKRGITDNLTAGPPLRTGHRYTLKIDRNWPDANGKPLAADYEKSITGAPEVRMPVDPAAWKVTAPVTDKSRLIIDFPRPMDHALALRVITVPGVEGAAELSQNETRWTFTPKSKWPKGKHEIRIEGIIEDLAGNRLHRLFDVDTADAAQTQPPPPSASVWFTAP